MRRGKKLWVHIATAALFLASCATQPLSVSDRLYLGRSKPGGSIVTDADWEAFMREEITPRFPAGLTMWPAQGQWRAANGVVMREPVMVLEIVHAPDQTDNVAAIALAYKRRFAQETVLRLTTPAHAILVK